MSIVSFLKVLCFCFVFSSVKTFSSEVVKLTKEPPLISVEGANASLFVSYPTNNIKATRFYKDSTVDFLNDYGVVVGLSYDEIRGSINEGIEWPYNGKVGEKSLLSILREKCAIGSTVDIMTYNQLMCLMKSANAKSHYEKVVGLMKQKGFEGILLRDYCPMRKEDLSRYERGVGRTRSVAGKSRLVYKFSGEIISCEPDKINDRCFSFLVRESRVQEELDPEFWGEPLIIPGVTYQNVKRQIELFDDPIKGSWSENYSLALSKAKKDGSNLILYFTGFPWCGYCLKFDYTILKKNEFRETIKNSYCVYLNYDKESYYSVQNGENKQLEGNYILLKKYGIQFVPTIIIIDKDENIIKRVDGKECFDTNLGL